MTDKKNNFLKQWSLTPKEELLYHNLETKKSWLRQGKIKEKAGPERNKTEGRFFKTEGRFFV